jgi:hypothetical protein
MRNLAITVAVISAGWLVTGCGSTLRAGDQQTTASFNVEPIAGTDLKRVKLTPKAAERIAVKTAHVTQDQVTREGTTTLRKIVPYESVLYGSNSATWVYTSPEPLVFVRHRIAIEYIDKGRAVLSDGPAAGTAVVTAGAAELFSTEFDTAR